MELLAQGVNLVQPYAFMPEEGGGSCTVYVPVQVCTGILSKFSLCSGSNACLARSY